MKRIGYLTAAIAPRMKTALIIAACVLGTPTMADHVWDNRDIPRGRVLYAEQCASCHGTNLEGQSNWRSRDENGVLPAPPHDETGHTWHHDPQILFDYTRLGGAEALSTQGVTGFSSGMPGFSDVLTDDDIWAVLAYVRSTWPERIQDVQASRSEPHE